MIRVLTLVCFLFSGSLFAAKGDDRPNIHPKPGIPNPVHGLPIQRILKAADCDEVVSQSAKLFRKKKIGELGILASPESAEVWRKWAGASELMVHRLIHNEDVAKAEGDLKDRKYLLQATIVEIVGEPRKLGKTSVVQPLRNIRVWTKQDKTRYVVAESEIVYSGKTATSFDIGDVESSKDGEIAKQVEAATEEIVSPTAKE